MFTMTCFPTVCKKIQGDVEELVLSSSFDSSWGSYEEMFAIIGPHLNQISRLGNGLKFFFLFWLHASLLFSPVFLQGRGWFSHPIPVSFILGLDTGTFDKIILFWGGCSCATVSTSGLFRCFVTFLDIWQPCVVSWILAMLYSWSLL